MVLLKIRVDLGSADICRVNLNSVHKYVDGLLRLRDSCPDLFIIARTDAETPEDIDERLSALFVSHLIM